MRNMRICWKSRTVTNRNVLPKFGRSTFVCSIAALVVSFALSACGTSQPVSFAPLRFDDLSKIHLNVAHIEVIDQAPPGQTAGDLSGLAPTPPQRAFETLVHDRFVAAGSTGQGKITITKAQILHAPGGLLMGALTAQIDLYSPEGSRSGYAQARILRRFESLHGNVESPATLNEMTIQMMQDMNTELEYQIKNALHDWLVDASGVPVQSRIQQEDLSSVVPLTPNVSSYDPQPPAPERPPAAARQLPPLSVAPSSGPKDASAEPDAVFPLGAADDDVVPSRRHVVHSPPPHSLTLPTHAPPS